MKVNRGPSIGETIPPFALQDQHGAQRSSEELLGRGPLVIYFYPRDETPGCIAEACAFRDQYEVFRDAGAEVIGISGDSVGSHRSFAARHSLPFVLLADVDNVARKAFGVGKTLGLIAGRETFVVDAGGTVLHHFSSQLLATKHVREACVTIRSLAAASRS